MAVQEGIKGLGQNLTLNMLKKKVLLAFLKMGAWTCQFILNKYSSWKFSLFATSLIQSVKVINETVTYE